MTTTLDIESLQKAWLSYEEIEDINLCENEIKNNWKMYTLDEAFSQVRQNLFSQEDIHV